MMRLKDNSFIAQATATQSSFILRNKRQHTKMKRNIVATSEGSSCENDDSHAMSPQFSTVELSIPFHLNQEKVWAENVTKRLLTVTPFFTFLLQMRP